MTVRALVIGLPLALIVGALGPVLSLYVQGPNSSAYFTSQIAHFILFLLVAVVTVALGRLRRSWAFSKAELVVLFVLMSLANGTHIIVHHWVPLVASPFYYARTENNWLHEIVPYIPSWLVPHHVEGIRAFFEGSEQGGGIAWHVWIDPILGWMPLFLSLPVITICAMVILRRRWVEQERLIYPVVQLSLSMVQRDDRGSLVHPFLRRGAMWLGFAVPVITGAIVGLHAFFPFLPTVEVTYAVPLFKRMYLSFATLGFFFLIQREVAFGLWVFTLLNHLQNAVYDELGWATEAEPVISAWSYGTPSLVHQGMGAMIVLVLGGLWVGREHLANVFRKAFRGADNVRDDDEILSYRGAVFGLLLGTVVMAVWLWRMGIPAIGVVALMFFLAVIFLALTRVIVEGGVAVIYTPMVAEDAVMSAVGTSVFGPSGLMGLTFTRIFGNDLLNFVMPHAANGLKLAGEIDRRRRPLFWAMLAATLLGMFGALWMLLHLASTYGAINMSRIHFVWFPNYLGDYTAARIAQPTGPNALGWFHTGVGGAVMALLMLARRFWGWWPLHPIGFPISSTFRWMAFNAFLAWMIKGPILKYGGVSMYKAVRPFFLGLILGHFAIYGVFWIVNGLTGVTGNWLFP